MVSIPGLKSSFQRFIKVHKNCHRFNLIQGSVYLYPQVSSWVDAEVERTSWIRQAVLMMPQVVAAGECLQGVEAV